MTTANQTLDQITRAEAEAQDAAAKALAAAEVARHKADRARERAEQEREVANRAYLDLLAEEWPDARRQATTTVADAYQVLDQAVRNGGDVFVAYRGWVGASIKAWELDEALGRMRRFHGVSMRESPAPVFNFGLDVGAIIDRIGLEFQDEAVQRIDQRCASYLAGKASS
jgi:hypothetical protein